MSMTSERHNINPGRSPRPLPRHERYIYTYRLVANGAPLHFLISCAYKSAFFSLFSWTDIVITPTFSAASNLTSLTPGSQDQENIVSDFRWKQMESNDRYVNLLRGYLESIHGSYISSFCTWILPYNTKYIKKMILIPNFFFSKNFFFFSMFPGKSSLSVPANCLWSLRVWLRVNGVDHRLFGEDDLWVAKDPEFNAIEDASFARLRNLDGGEQVYHGYVGKALVTFTIRYVSYIFLFFCFYSLPFLSLPSPFPSLYL